MSGRSQPHALPSFAHDCFLLLCFFSVAGECGKNPNFMHSSCAASCGSCGKDPTDLLGAADLHLGDWEWHALNVCVFLIQSADPLFAI